MLSGLSEIEYAFGISFFSEMCSGVGSNPVTKNIYLPLIGVVFFLNGMISTSIRYYFLKKGNNLLKIR